MDTASPIKQLTVFPVEINKYLIELETSTENAPQNGDMILGHSLLSCILQDSIDYITQKGYEKQPQASRTLSLGLFTYVLKF